MDKTKILEEIRRTTEANDGVAPGREKFLQKTGIKESDWLGKFWTKWSDAVLEAGYKPNVMQTAFSDDLVLASYANFIQVIGHIPTSPEVRMKARDDTNFPSHNTFGRFGSKKQLLSRLLLFCRQNNNFSDVVTLLENDPSIEPTQDFEVEPKQTENGYVYLMQFGSEYKIGSSNNVERRFRELKTQMPYEGKIIHTITTGDPEGIEAYWHQFFKNNRLKGEWFKLSMTEIRYFKKRTLM